MTDEELRNLEKGWDDWLNRSEAGLARDFG